MDIIEINNPNNSTENFYVHISKDEINISGKHFKLTFNGEEESKGYQELIKFIECIKRK